MQKQTHGEMAESATEVQRRPGKARKKSMGADIYWGSARLIRNRHGRK